MVGKFEHGLSNLSVYFWRWGTWKVFDAHPEHPPGIIALITTAAYLRAPVGFQKSAWACDLQGSAAMA